MLNRIFRIMFSVIGAILGISVLKLVLSVVDFTIGSSVFFIAVNVLVALLFAGIFYFLSGFIYKMMEDVFMKLEKYLEDLPPLSVAVGISGVIVGLILAFLATKPLSSLSLPVVGNSIFVLLSIIIYLGFGLLGWKIASKYPDKYPQTFQKVKNVKISNRRENKKRQAADGGRANEIYHSSADPSRKRREAEMYPEMFCACQRSRRCKGTDLYSVRDAGVLGQGGYQRRFKENKGVDHVDESRTVIRRRKAGVREKGGRGSST